MDNFNYFAKTMENYYEFVLPTQNENEETSDPLNTQVDALAQKNLSTSGATSTPPPAQKIPIMTSPDITSALKEEQQTKRIAQQTKRIAEQKALIDSLQQILAKTPKDPHQLEHDRLVKELGDLQKKLDQQSTLTEQKIQGAQKNASKKASAAISAQEQVTELLAALSDLQDENTSLKQKVTGLQRTVAKLEKDLQEIELDLEEQNSIKETDDSGYGSLEPEIYTFEPESTTDSSPEVTAQQIEVYREALATLQHNLEEFLTSDDKDIEGFLKHLGHVLKITLSS